MNVSLVQSGGPEEIRSKLADVESVTSKNHLGSVTKVDLLQGADTNLAVWNQAAPVWKSLARKIEHFKQELHLLEKGTKKEHESFAPDGKFTPEQEKLLKKLKEARKTASSEIRECYAEAKELKLAVSSGSKELEREASTIKDRLMPKFYQLNKKAELRESPETATKKAVNGLKEMHHITLKRAEEHAQIEEKMAGVRGRLAIVSNKLSDQIEVLGMVAKRRLEVESAIRQLKQLEGKTPLSLEVEIASLESVRGRLMALELRTDLLFGESQTTTDEKILQAHQDGFMLGISKEDLEPISQEADLIMRTINGLIKSVSDIEGGKSGSLFKELIGFGTDKALRPQDEGKEWSNASLDKRFEQLLLKSSSSKAEIKSKIERLEKRIKAGKGNVFLNKAVLTDLENRLQRVRLLELAVFDGLLAKTELKSLDDESMMKNQSLLEGLKAGLEGEDAALPELERVMQFSKMAKTKKGEDIQEPSLERGLHVLLSEELRTLAALDQEIASIENRFKPLEDMIASLEERNSSVAKETGDGGISKGAEGKGIASRLEAARILLQDLKNSSDIDGLKMKRRELSQGMGRRVLSIEKGGRLNFEAVDKERAELKEIRRGIKDNVKAHKSAFQKIETLTAPNIEDLGELPDIPKHMKAVTPLYEMIRTELDFAEMMKGYTKSIRSDFLKMFKGDDLKRAEEFLKFAAELQKRSEKAAHVMQSAFADVISNPLLSEQELKDKLAKGYQQLADSPEMQEWVELIGKAADMKAEMDKIVSPLKAKGQYKEMNAALSDEMNRRGYYRNIPAKIASPLEDMFVRPYQRLTKLAALASSQEDELTKRLGVQEASSSPLKMAFRQFQEMVGKSAEVANTSKKEAEEAKKIKLIATYGGKVQKEVGKVDLKKLATVDDLNSEVEKIVGKAASNFFGVSSSIAPEERFALGTYVRDELASRIEKEVLAKIGKGIDEGIAALNDPVKAKDVFGNMDPKDQNDQVMIAKMICQKAKGSLQLSHLEESLTQELVRKRVSKA